MLLRDGRVDDETYASASQLLGTPGVVDLVGLVGYYCLIALTLNAHEVAVPADAEIPWHGQIRD
jgi:4-carboxymuconolactone decarboxylase